ncbi:MAG TPA: DUF2806 domain-containing protein [Bacteroidia bacterium]|jgi:hypothetical protein
MSGLSVFKGKPIEKLLSLVGDAFGTLYKPKAIKNEADAEAYKIEVLERAKSKALSESKLREVDTLNIIQSRVLHQELQKQSNIDSVIQIAKEQIEQEETVSEEPVNKDWSTRFFNIVEDISDSEMQSLWGRILAGEVKTPKSYSLRTLEILKNFSKEDAMVFSKIGKCALKADHINFIYYPDSGKILKELFEISFDDILYMAEIGLVAYETNLTLKLPLSIAETKLVVQNGIKAVIVRRPPGCPEQVIPALYFTKPGCELLSLLDPYHNEKYLLDFCSKIKLYQFNKVFLGEIAGAGLESKIINEVEIHPDPVKTKF